MMVAAGAGAREEGGGGGVHTGDSPRAHRYEASPLSAPGSPRRGIRTVLAPNESFTFPQEITSEVIEKRLDLPETLRGPGSGPHTPKVVSATAKDAKAKVKVKVKDGRSGPLVTSTPRVREPRFILPLEEVRGRGSPDDKVMALSLELEFVQKERLKIMSGMTVLKARLGEIDAQREEAARAAAIEKAFVGAEQSSQAERARAQQARIAALRERADQCQREVESWQENRIAQQRVFSMSLEHAEQELQRLQQEERLQGAEDQAELRDRVLQQADVVESEKKLYEDLEFKYLEEESVWLARREELSKELAEAVRKHEETVARLQELEAAAQVAELECSLEGYEEQRQAYLQRLDEGQAQLDMLDGRVDELLGQGAGNLTGASSSSLNDLDSNSSDPFSSSGLTSMESSFCSYIEVKPKAAQNGKEYVCSDGAGGNNVDKRCPGDVPPRPRSPPSGASVSPPVAARPVGNRAMAPPGPGLAAVVALAEADSGRLGARLLEPRVGRGPEGGGAGARVGEDGLGPLPAPVPAPALGLQLQLSRPQQGPRPRRQQRPLTRYLPIRTTDLDLRQHIESAGHAVELCRHVQVDGHSCRGVLHKASARFGNWQKRWFVFDRSSRTLAYFKSRRDTRVRGGIHFQAIAEVYVDHMHGHKHATPNCVFVVKTTQRAYQLMAPSPEAMRIWVDVIFTGAEAYQEFD